MKRLNLQNPFGGPVYHEESVSSTMDAARTLAANNEPHGTVIAADFQEQGRGRQNRQWKMEKGQNLMFTILLKYPDFSSVPKALTLRTGLAVALSIEEFIPALADLIAVKWPNDLMLMAKKAMGILVESDGANVYIGIGVNLLQREFPLDLQDKAGSLLSVYMEKFPGAEIPETLANSEAPLLLLEKILYFLHEELTRQENSWKTSLERRLYKRGEPVLFAEGAADSQKLIKGRLEGIGEGGELLILPDEETKSRYFINGELKVY